MGIKHSKEEIDIVYAVKGKEFKSVKNLEIEKQRHNEYAADTLRKDKSVNNRITEKQPAEIL